MNIKIILCCFVFSGMLHSQEIFIRDTLLMGSPFRITIVEHSQDSADYKINKAIDEMVRVEALISEWQPHTQVSKINQQAGVQAVKVSPELIRLTQLALHFSELSYGAFDISIAAMDKIWKFDGSMQKLPSLTDVKKSIEHVGYKNIVIDEVNSTIYLAKKAMKIGFGSIGKGYAADRGVHILKTMGVKAGIVDASGDLSVFGSQPNGKPWRIGVRNPYNESWADILDFRNASVTTSGDYEKYAFIDGTRYGHIINPHTGYPSKGLISVSVIGKEATIANGLSTSLMVLGVKEGLELMKLFPDYACLFITQQGKVLWSKNYKKLKRKFYLR